MIPGNAPGPPWDDPLYPGLQQGGGWTAFWCRECDVRWSNGRECWVCGQEWRPLTVAQVVAGVG